MKTLLICPSVRPAVPHLSHSGPLAASPFLGDSVISHWIEHLAELGARHIQVVAVEGADQLRAAVGDGSRWGVRIELIAAKVEPTWREVADNFRTGDEEGWLPAPHAVVPLSHPPGCPEKPLFESYASWFAALLAWMPRAITPSRVRVSEARPGIWIGSRAQVSPRAELIGPCWVGDRVCVEAGAVVGPDAILEDRSVVGRRAIVTKSWVGPDTFVGPMTCVAHSLAWGSTLIDWQNDSSLRVPDPFLLCSLSGLPSAAVTDRFGRAIGAKETYVSKHKLITALHAPLGSASGLNPSV